jgi:Putative beta-barrel porin-2, OmpL-like. bbp2
MNIQLFRTLAATLGVLALCATNTFAQDKQSPKLSVATVFVSDDTTAAPADEAKPQDENKSSADSCSKPADKNCGKDCSCGSEAKGCGSECTLDCPEQDITRLFNCCRIKNCGASLTGWVNGGIMLNGDNPDSHFNGPTTFTDRDEGQLDQLYMVYEKTAEANNCGLFIGGRVDYFWGNDYYFTTSAGLDGSRRGNVARWNDDDTFRYGSSLPQAYAEVDYNDLKIKLGHFYTPIGYETVPAKDNFFVTHSYTMQYGEPFSHTGLLATKPINDNLTWSAGIVEGWNTFDADTRAAFLGGLTYTVKDKSTLTFMLTTGDDSTVNLPGINPVANRTMYSLVWNATLNSRLTYVAQHDLGVQQDAATLQGTDTAEWYGLNQYLFYKLNCKWTAGVRFEWFRDDDGFNVTGLRPGNPLVGNFFAGNFYETAIGLNYKPNGNFTIRPEVRYDSFHPGNAQVGSQNPFDDNNSQHQFLYGIDAIVQF